jgi:ATP-binding cassette subfamily B protein
MDDEKERLSGDRKMKLGEILRHSWPYIKKEKWAIILALFLFLLNVAIHIVLPIITSRYVDILKKDIDHVTVRMIVSIAIGYGSLAVAGEIIRYVQSITLAKAGQRIVYKMRMDIFEHIENMSLNQFNQMPVGSFVTRVANYTSAVSELFTSVLVSLISVPPELTVCLSLSRLSPPYTIALSLQPVFFRS